MTDEIETLIAIVCEANDDEHKRHSRAIAPVDAFRMGVVLQWAKPSNWDQGLRLWLSFAFPHLVDRAAAGIGKLFVFSLQFLHLIERQIAPPSECGENVRAANLQIEGLFDYSTGQLPPRDNRANVVVRVHTLCAFLLTQ